MYVVLVAMLLVSGVTLSWNAMSRPAVAAQLERASGALLVAGLALLGFGLPVVQHLSPG